MIYSAQESLSDDLSVLPTSTHFDTIIVFGQGPVKPLFLPSELPEDLRDKWAKYKQDQLHTREPNFFVLEDPVYLSKIDDIDHQKSSDLEKEGQKELLREIWQKTGHFALKKLGKQNALAAGLALYVGLTDSLILSGGKTFPPFIQKYLPQSRLEQWPSEAALMKDIIKRNFGKLYEERYHKNIEEAIQLEEASKNTLENFAYSINMAPQILSPHTKVGLLSAAHHMKRLTMLAEIFSIPHESDFLLSSESLIKKVSENNKKYQTIVKIVSQDQDEVEVKEQYTVENSCMEALREPAYITYWLGYVGELQTPAVIQKILGRLQDEVWKKATEEAFEKVGLKLDDFITEDIEVLYTQNNGKYMSLVEGIKKLKDPKYRELPLSVSM